MMAPAMRVNPTNPCQPACPPGTAAITLTLGPRASDARISKDAMVTIYYGCAGAWQVLSLLLSTTFDLKTETVRILDRLVCYRRFICSSTKSLFLYLPSDNPSSKYDGIGDEGRPNKSSPAGVSARNCYCYIGLGASSLRWKRNKGCHGDKINCKSRCLVGSPFVGACRNLALAAWIYLCYSNHF
jgi:hypothetical protein